MYVLSRNGLNVEICTEKRTRYEEEDENGLRFPNVVSIRQDAFVCSRADPAIDRSRMELGTWDLFSTLDPCIIMREGRYVFICMTRNMFVQVLTQPLQRQYPTGYSEYIWQATREAESNYYKWWIVRNLLMDDVMGRVHEFLVGRPRGRMIRSPVSLIVDFPERARVFSAMSQLAEMTTTLAHALIIIAEIVDGFATLVKSLM